jgi:hypothetical protein
MSGNACGALRAKYEATPGAGRLPHKKVNAQPNRKRSHHETAVDHAGDIRYARFEGECPKRGECASSTTSLLINCMPPRITSKSYRPRAICASHFGRPGNQQRRLSSTP